MEKDTIAVTHSAKQTISAGKQYAKKITGGTVLALYGNLGSGKTTFAQGIVQGLGIKQRIISPSFLIVKAYDVAENPHRITKFFHIDLYRTEGKASIDALGIDEIVTNPDSVTLIEWAEKMEQFLPKHVTRIHFENIADDERKIVYEY